jgi:Uma2 family endonuclease
MVITRDLREEILERLNTEELVRIPASESEYLDLAYHFPFKIEYHESEIYTMGLASFTHETLVSNWIFILKTLFKKGFFVQSSNSGVHIPKFEGGYYMPDAMVVKDKPIFKENSTAIITNPYIIIEVLSTATSKFDRDSKLPEYKHLDSLQQIIFVNQKKVEVSSYTRSSDENTWLNQDFYELDKEIMIDNKPISLASIYENIYF